MDNKKPTKVTITKKDVKKAIKSLKLGELPSQCCPMWQALNRLGMTGKFVVGGETIEQGRGTIATFSPRLPAWLYLADEWPHCLAVNYEMPSFKVKWLK